MKKLIPSITVCILLAGCTTKWVPATSHPAPFSEAKVDCKLSALQQFPVKNEIAQRSTLKMVQQPCFDKEQCGKNGYYSQNVPMVESYVTDVNEGSRREYYYGCMHQKGWKQITKSLL
ncbi:conserved exported protein of unknown function [Xenorhabdus poinarii G6]|uniref:Lipoprotein n=1 Tax=Xenorhabdus poinarii G6 TaxID=1354304 RepID=A0A068R4R9_9GAMM|nr:hypothetical protein [Xenorhabdus poinarii]CDG21120.1 conserved exported protein of unknown function [Xenorhabdus poinarii G6]